MPSLGGPELIVILVVVLIVFGAGRLPDVFGQLGKGIRSFREESSVDLSKDGKSDEAKKS